MEEVQETAPALHLMTCFEMEPMCPGRFENRKWGSGGLGETKENPQTTANISVSILLPVIFSSTYLALMWLN